MNRECSLGRPIEVAFCDDTADVNTNLACGRQAAGDGSLALLTTVGSFDDGATASGLPGIFLYGTSAFELTDPNAYSSISGISVGMAGVTAAKAAGADTFLLVLPDSPALQFVAVQVEQVAELIDIDLETIYFPTDTTDYAPIAAQISQRDPEAIGLLPVSPVVMINALADEGLTPESHIMSMASIVLTPEIVTELGSALDGMIVVSPTVPPNAVDNPGIAEFRDDLEAIGEDPDAPTIDFTTVTAWSNIKKLEEALLGCAATSHSPLLGSSASTSFEQLVADAFGADDAQAVADRLDRIDHLRFGLEPERRDEAGGAAACAADRHRRRSRGPSVCADGVPRDR